MNLRAKNTVSCIVASFIRDFKIQRRNGNENVA